MNATLTSPAKGSMLTTSIELTRFLDSVNVDCYSGPERRVAPRFPLLVPVAAQAVDEDGKRFGDLIRGVSRDISASGISILTSTPIEASCVGLKLTPHTGEEVNLMMAVARSRPIGPYFETAGRIDVESAK